MSAPLTVRAYVQTDWAAIEAVHDEARKRELALAGLDAAFLPLRIAAEREDLFAYTLLVAERDGRVAGFAAYEEGELAWMYVAQACARQGVGTALARQVLRKSEQRPMYVEVLCGNEPARRLYEKLGFRLFETVSGVMPGNESFAVRVWRLRLD